jgi:hypothetical protein
MNNNKPAEVECGSVIGEVTLVEYLTRCLPEGLVPVVAIEQSAHGVAVAPVHLPIVASTSSTAS